MVFESLTVPNQIRQRQLPPCLAAAFAKRMALAATVPQVPEVPPSLPFGATSAVHAASRVAQLFSLGIKRTMNYQEYLKNGEWKTYSLAHYPDAPKPVQFWLVLAFFAIMTLCMVAGYLTGYFRSCFIAALIITICLYAKTRPIRCPKCHEQVVTRVEDTKQDGQNYRQFFHDCPSCQVTWICKKTFVSDS